MSYPNQQPPYENQQSQQVGYGAPQAGYYPTPAPATNVLAIVSLVTSILGMSIIGIVCGHLALSQIKKTGENGHGMAMAGLIIGYVGLVLVLLITIFFIIVPLIFIGTMPTNY